MQKDRCREPGSRGAAHRQYGSLLTRLLGDIAQEPPRNGGQRLASRTRMCWQTVSTTGILRENAIMIARILLGVLIGAGIGAALGHFSRRFSGARPLRVNPCRGALLGAIFGAAIAFALPYAPETQSRESGRRTPGHAPPATPGEHAPVHIGSEADFKARVLDASGICLVDLFSDGCPPCRALAPTIASLADKHAGKVTVCKVDVDQLPSLAGRYRVSAIPTVLIVNNGRLMERLVGLRPEAEYVAILDRLLDEAGQ